MSTTAQKAKYDIVDYIKENINIDNVVNKLGGLQLKKKGKILVGNCPTSHPSNSGTCFNVITESDFCYCHSCGKGGSVIDLVMMAENLTFIEALKWFKINYNLGNEFSSPDTTDPEYIEKLSLEKKLKIKSLLFEKLVEEGKEMLFKPEGKEALEYLVNKRKFDPELIKKTELLYLPLKNEAKQFLYKTFPELSEEISSLKLEGHYGDNFRLAFPYRDKNGLITGLMKRATNPEGASGKTWNGDEFKEQRFDSSTGLSKDDLFGLNKIKNQETVVIVEGYFDAMYLFELGITNIAAVGQGKLSKSHLVGLDKKGIKNVILAFDNDKVGPGNTYEAVKLLLKDTTITPFVLDPKSLGENIKDPDEFVRLKGIEAFKDLLKKVTKGVVWCAGFLLDNSENSSELEKQNSLNEVAQLSQLIKNQLDYEELVVLVSNKQKCSKTTIKNLFKSAQTGVSNHQSQGNFWSISNGSVQENMKDYIDFIINEGFAKYYLDLDYTFIRKNGNIVRECSIPQIKDHVLSFVESLEDDEHDTKRKLYETIYSKPGQFFGEGLLECIPPQEVTFKRDEKDKAYIYYGNGYISLNKNSSPVLNSYNDLESPIWENTINKRNVSLINTKYKKAEYEQFLWNVVGGKENRFLALCSAIGYMLHDYKEESNAKAIVLCDQKIQSDNEPNGRTGKSLIGKALEKIKKVERVDGKNFAFKPTFTFQMVKLGTQIIDFNDVEPNFNFERLFSVITDGMTIEYKNKTPFVIPFAESPKIMISTNYTIKGVGSSYKDRMFEIEFTDHYSPEHKPKDEFGHDFFSGWDEEEWNRFDNFMLECLQLYLDEGLIGCELVNLSKRKLIDITSADFVEFSNTFIEKNKEYNLTTLFTEFKEQIGFPADAMFDKCPIKQNTFTSWLQVYAQFYDLEFKKRQSNGKQLVTLAG